MQIFLGKILEFLKDYVIFLDHSLIYTKKNLNEFLARIFFFRLLIVLLVQEIHPYYLVTLAFDHSVCSMTTMQFDTQALLVSFITSWIPDFWNNSNSFLEYFFFRHFSFSLMMKWFLQGRFKHYRGHFYWLFKHLRWLDIHKNVSEVP